MPYSTKTYSLSVVSMGYFVQIELHSHSVGKILVNQEKADVIIPQQVIRNCGISVTLSASKNGTAL